MQQDNVPFLYIEKRIPSFALIKDVLVNHEDTLLDHESKLAQEGYLK